MPENGKPSEVAPKRAAMTSIDAAVSSTGVQLQLGVDLSDPEQRHLLYGYAEREREWIETSGHWRDWIEINPNIMVGKPVFKQTRLTVELILENLGAGASEADLLKTYPRLRPEHIRAAMAFAADALRRPEPTFLHPADDAE